MYQLTLVPRLSIVFFLFFFSCSMVLMPINRSFSCSFLSVCQFLSGDGQMLCHLFHLLIGRCWQLYCMSWLLLVLISLSLLCWKVHSTTVRISRKHCGHISFFILVALWYRWKLTMGITFVLCCVEKNSENQLILYEKSLSIPFLLTSPPQIILVYFIWQKIVYLF